MSADCPVQEGQIPTGPLFSEPMRVEPCPLTASAVESSMMINGR